MAVLGGVAVVAGGASRARAGVRGAALASVVRGVALVSVVRGVALVSVVRGVALASVVRGALPPRELALLPPVVRVPPVVLLLLENKQSTSVATAIAQCSQLNKWG